MAGKDFNYWMYHLAAHAIPDHRQAGLARYFAERRPTGSFLRAVLENDLCRAAMGADAVNLQSFRHYATFLKMMAPPESWGSPEKVKQWIEGKANDRI